MRSAHNRIGSLQLIRLPAVAYLIRQGAKGTRMASTWRRLETAPAAGPHGVDVDNGLPDCSRSPRRDSEVARMPLTLLRRPRPPRPLSQSKVSVALVI